MPIYEYECTRCGEIFEIMQSFSDKPPNKCKKCNGKLRKKISMSTFHLKGSGWYVTDYAHGANPGNQPKRSGDNGAEGKAGKNGDKKAAAGKDDVQASSDKASPPSDKSSKPSKSESSHA
ncbi:MAG: zinc ribbon domain-containing protein [Deltaproteobacteria bacterium]|nr:zinc ribbon domain-containing protein [Deltaproteobacteria bacterium]